MKLRIVTDTAADCLKQEITAFNIDIIDLPVTFDNETETCHDMTTFWSKLLDGGVARTSQPSPEDIKKCFTAAKDAGDELIFVTISSRLSGTYESALSIQKELGYDNVYIVDSLNASASEKVLVLEACKMRDEGLGAKQIVEKLEQLKHKVRIYAYIDTLKYLARGGRISKSTAAIGSLINIKPLIEFVDGEIHNFGKAVGTTIATRKFTEYLAKQNIDYNYQPIPIYSYNNKNALSFIKHACELKIEIDSANLTPIGATIATHIGPDAFGIVFVVK